MGITLDSGDLLAGLWVAGVGTPPPEALDVGWVGGSGGGVPTPATQGEILGISRIERYTTPPIHLAFSGPLAGAFSLR